MEKFLLDEELQAIDELIDLGQETYTWNSEGMFNQSVIVRIEVRRHYIVMREPFLSLINNRYIINLWILIPNFKSRIKIRKNNYLPGVTDYVLKLYDMIKSLYGRVNEAQDNLSGVMKRMEIWSEVPILVRRDVKQGGLLPVMERRDVFEKRYQAITNDVEDLMKVLEENYNLYFDLVPEEEEENGEFLIWSTELREKCQIFIIFVVFQRTTSRFLVSSKNWSEWFIL